MLRASFVLLLLTLVFFPHLSFGALTITIGGAYSALDTSSGFTVYAGLSGSTDCTLSAALDSSCNNCTGVGSSVATPTVCNANFVGPTARLWVNFKSDKGGSLIVNDGGTHSIIPQSGSTLSVVAGGTGVLILKWADICGQLYSDSSCKNGSDSTHLHQGASLHISDGTDSANINITTQYLDASATPTEGIEPVCGTATDGACDFSLFPGDEKVYINGLTGADAGYPTNRTNGGLGFQSLRLFYAVDATNATDCSGVTVDSIKYDSPSVDVAVSAGTPPTAATSFLSNFHNNVNYCFLAANVDKAMNVGFLTKTLKPVRPSEVFGILTKENNCFIATAAYGSALDPHVQTFREFRGKYLMNHEWGRKFVGWYYQHAPYWAHGIEQDEQARAEVRFFLWPLYFLASLMLLITPMGTFAALATVTASGLILAKRKRRT